MHIYVYDSFVNQKKYDKILARIETRITDLGLNGKIARLSLMKNIPDLINNELKRNAKTIIAVGNDKTINQVINSLAGKNIPLGIIPIGQNDNLIARSLGIPIEEAACDILAKRRAIKLDLGRANNLFFLSNVTIVNHGTVIEIDQSYLIEILEQGIINIVNIAINKDGLPHNLKSNPQDGILELFIQTKKSKNFIKKITGQSVFSFKKLNIINKKEPAVLDNLIKIPTPVEISIAKQNIEVIVGKNRSF